MYFSLSLIKSLYPSLYIFVNIMKYAEDKNQIIFSFCSVCGRLSIEKTK